LSPTLDHLLSPIAQWLHDPATEDVCINAPNECWVYGRGGFTRHAISLSAIEIEDIAIVAAAQRQLDVGNGRPILSTDIAGAWRLQAVLPFCVEEGFPSLTIRRGSDVWPTIAELASKGLFKKTQRKRRDNNATDGMLIELYQAERWEEFFCLAVRSKKTMVICGENASGKTHFSKACIAEIPKDERLLIIENAPELRGVQHPNRVQMFCEHSRNKNRISPTDLVEAALRMRIGRLFLQEIRSGADTLAFLVANMTGHKGAITTIHAGHCKAVFDRMRVLIKQADGGDAISDADINAQLHETVDVVVHFERYGSEFSLDEAWFHPVSLKEEGDR
jgi:type IV secretion system protein VirB11